MTRKFIACPACKGWKKTCETCNGIGTVRAGRQPWGAGKTALLIAASPAIVCALGVLYLSAQVMRSLDDY